MKTMGDINEQISNFYAPLFLDGLKYGENQVNLWFPGGGKSVVINDILSNKKILLKYLGKFANRLEIINYSCSGGLNSTAEDVLLEIACKLGVITDNNQEQLIFNIIKKCNQIVTLKDKVIVFVGSKFEDIETQEFKKLITSLAKIVSENRRCFFSILNIIDGYLLKNIISEKPSIYSLATRIKIIPLISGKLLESYINQRVDEYNKVISTNDRVNIINSTGGLLFLTREIIRNFPEEGQLNERLLSIWKKIPERYKQNIELENKIHNKDLECFGINKLNIFKAKRSFLNSDPEKSMSNCLNETELSIYKTFKSNENKLVSRDQIARIIWGKNYEEKYSDWAIDQTVSRFRKKIAKYYISKDTIKTIKGRGYKWKL